MNILFLYTSSFDPNKGGVQRVSTVLGEYFKNNNHNVYYLSLKKSSSSVDNQFFLPVELKFELDDNILFIHNLIKKKRIEFIINQGALGSKCSEFSYYCLSKGIKLISVIHNSPLASILNFSSSKNNKFKKYGITFLLPLTDIKAVKNFILWLYKTKYETHYTKLIENSHSVLLLSDSFRKELQFFYSKKLPKTVHSIPNPVSFVDSDVTVEKKDKIALFVGRVDFAQKRVDLLLKIWLIIANNYPDWILKIVGDGPDLAAAIKYCKKHKLSTVFFEGFQNPVPYYKEASILCMTSSYEGFPLVLVEAQYFGLVPVAFHSYNSITDVISDKNNGILVNPFDIDNFASELSALMDSPEKIKSMASNAIVDSQKFSLKSVGKQWFNLLESLT